MSTQELFSNLKCARCGTKDAEISEYKTRGVIPICANCRKKVQIVTGSNVPYFLLITAFSIITGFITINALMSLRTPGNILNLLWYRNLVIASIVLFISIIIIFILRKAYGLKLKENFRDRNGPVIASETDTEWLSYREWIHKTLLEKGISENTISNLIEAEIKRQKTIKDKKLKRGRMWMRIGMGSILFGLISLIYGYYVTYGLIGYTIDAALAFTVFHLPTAAILLLFGFIDFISGKKQKKFYNLV